MTNSYDVDHGLSQDAPGPLEPVEIAQQPGAAPATGNTARDQEMYAAGLEKGEENAKHNAAIRAGVPDGWKLVPIEPTNAMVVEGVNAGLKHKDEPYFIYAAMLNAAPAAPGVSTVEDAQDENDVLSWLEVEIGALNCRYHGDPSYDHDAYWMRDRVLRLIEDARKAFCAPAAGDALAGSAPEWATCESRGPWARNSLKAAVDLLREKETRARYAFTKDYMGLPARYIADAYGEAAAVVERKLGAIAAQRKGDA